MLVMEPINLLQNTHTSFFRFSYECILNTKIFELKDCFNVPHAAVNDQVARIVKQLFITSKVPLQQKLIRRRNPGRVPGLVEAVQNVMAHGNAWEGKLRGNGRLERVATTLALYLGTWSIHGLPADPHFSTTSS